MARTAFTSQNIPVDGSLNPVVWTAADAANGMQVAIDGWTNLIVCNTDGSTHTVTAVSVNDPYGRSGDITLTVPALAASIPGLVAFGLLTPALWSQSGTNLIYVNFSSATGMNIAALKMNPRR